MHEYEFIDIWLPCFVHGFTVYLCSLASSFSCVTESPRRWLIQAETYRGICAVEYMLCVVCH